MPFYPVNLNISGRPCLVIGGGKVAARKVQGLLAGGARVTVISPEISPTLRALVQQEKLAWIDRPYRQGDLAGAFLVIAATDDEATQQAIQEEAEHENLLLNITDVPHRCNFILPSILRRGELTIAVSTGGKSPALAKQLREELESRFGPEYEQYLELLGALRTAILAVSGSPDENRAIFQDLLHPRLPNWIRAGDWPQIEDHLRGVLTGKIDSAFLTGIKERFASTISPSIGSV